MKNIKELFILVLFAGIADSNPFNVDNLAAAQPVPSTQQANVAHSNHHPQLKPELYKRNIQWLQPPINFQEQHQSQEKVINLPNRNNFPIRNLGESENMNNRGQADSELENYRQELSNTQNINYNLPAETKKLAINANQEPFVSLVTSNNINSRKVTKPVPLPQYTNVAHPNHRPQLEPQQYKSNIQWFQPQVTIQEQHQSQKNNRDSPNNYISPILGKTENEIVNNRGQTYPVSENYKTKLPDKATKITNNDSQQPFVSLVTRNNINLRKDFDAHQYITQNPGVKKILDTIKHEKKFMVIHPDGRIEHVDDIQPFIHKNSQYVLLNKKNIEKYSKKMKENQASEKTILTSTDKIKNNVTQESLCQEKKLKASSSDKKVHNKIFITPITTEPPVLKVVEEMKSNNGVYKYEMQGTPDIETLINQIKCEKNPEPTTTNSDTTFSSAYTFDPNAAEPYKMISPPSTSAIFQELFVEKGDDKSSEKRNILRPEPGISTKTRSEIKVNFTVNQDLARKEIQNENTTNSITNKVCFDTSETQNDNILEIPENQHDLISSSETTTQKCIEYYTDNEYIPSTAEMQNDTNKSTVRNEDAPNATTKNYTFTPDNSSCIIDTTSNSDHYQDSKIDNKSETTVNDQHKEDYLLFFRTQDDQMETTVSKEGNINEDLPDEIEIQNDTEAKSITKIDNKSETTVNDQHKEDYPLFFRTQDDQMETTVSKEGNINEDLPDEIEIQNDTEAKSIANEDKINKTNPNKEITLNYKEANSSTEETKSDSIIDQIMDEESPSNNEPENENMLFKISKTNLIIIQEPSADPNNETLHDQEYNTKNSNKTKKSGINLENLNLLFKILDGNYWRQLFETYPIRSIRLLLSGKIFGT